jgi:hypothetical protein
MAVALLLGVGCGDEPGSIPESPPSAKVDLVEMLREDLAAERHPADGGGTVRLLGTAEETGAQVWEPRSWEFLFEAGPEGIAEGGSLYFQVSPFWGWTTPQAERPERPGYTTVTTDAEGVVLEPATLDRQLLGVRISGRALAAEEQIRIVYGDGEVGAFPDDYAEGRSPFWFAVDGDGDGVRGLLDDTPSVSVRAGPAERLLLTLPSTARPGDSVWLHLAFLDGGGNAGVELTGEVALESELAGPEVVTLDADDRGLLVVELRAPAPGSYAVRAVGPGGLAAESNPLVVGDGPRILWGDLHGHSAISDGTGTPEEYYRYARDVAGLDVTALTDHDHWGMRPLSTAPDLWNEILATGAAFHEPGRFVTLPGYEWTNWIHGHRHVLYFDDPRPEVLSSLDPDYDTPAELWEALAGRSALTFAHHSAGGPVATDWSYPPDPELEPVTEVVSVHGSSEALDSPGVIYSPLVGNFVRDVLDRGYRLGMIGSGDSHDGHPGLVGRLLGQGGLAGIFAEEATREAVLEALRARRVYATSGPRILLRTSVGGKPMGSVLAAAGPPAPLEIEVAAPAPIDRVDVIRSGEPWGSLAGDGRTELLEQVILADLEPGEYLYVRVVLEGGGAAWSSPYFVDP